MNISVQHVGKLGPVDTGHDQHWQHLWFPPDFTKAACNETRNPDDPLPNNPTTPKCPDCLRYERTR